MPLGRTYNDPSSNGVTKNLNATRGLVGTRGVPASRAAPAGPQGAGQDFYELLNPSITQGGRRTDKPVELYQTWTARDPQNRNVIQQGYALTINTFAGLGWEQRDWLTPGAQMGLSEGSLLAHYDDVALPFAMENTDVDYAGLNSHFTGQVMAVVFQGRAIWAVNYGAAIYAETSTTSPTPVRILSSYVGSGIAGGYAVSLNVMIIDGIECLVVGTAQYTYAFSSIEPPTVHASTTSPITIVGGAIQVPLPKQPILSRVGSTFYLLRSDWSVSAPTLSVDNQTNTIRSTGGSIRTLAAVAQEPPKVWMLEPDGKITTCNAYGTDYQEFTRLSMTRVHQFDFIGRAMVARDQERIIYYDGDEYDTGIFEDAAPVSGYFYLVNAMVIVDDVLFADVNLVPNGLKTITSGTDFGNLASTKRALWRLEMKRQHPRWSQVSEWTEWNAHDIAPQGGPFVNSAGVFGHITSGLVYGPSTRRIHAIPYTSQNPTYRKFEPPAGQNYYSLRGNYALASAGGSPTDLTKAPRLRTPGLVFPAPLTYLDKYLDAVYWGGRDTGGSGSSVTFRWGEMGHLDDTSPGPLQAVFNQGLSHAGRRIPFDNRTSVLFPQIEMSVTRGSTTTATPSILPLTIHFHVDLEPETVRRPRWPWQGWARSNG